jgi:hypothetical protein
VIDLPQPDSPTSARVSRRAMLNEMSSTAGCQAPWMRNSVRRCVTASAGPSGVLAAAAVTHPLSVCPGHPGDAGDLDAVVGEGLGLFGGGLAVDAAGLGVAAMDLAGFLGE